MRVELKNFLNTIKFSHMQQKTRLKHVNGLTIVY